LVYTCAVCGEVHDEEPLGYGWRVPDLLSDKNAKQLEKRHWLVVDELVTGRDDARDRFFAIKGNIEIPIRGSDDRFVWTVWQSLSPENAERALDLWFEPSRVDEPPYSGWLLNAIPGYAPLTHGLPATTWWREPRVRPAILVEDPEHPLAREQDDGIGRERVIEIASMFRHDLGWIG
jgi:hypothetical protein